MLAISKIRTILKRTTAICSLLLLPAIVHAIEACQVEKPRDGCIAIWDANSTTVTQKKVHHAISNHILITDTESRAYSYVEFEFGMIRQATLPSMEILEGQGTPFRAMRPLWTSAMKDIQASQDQGEVERQDVDMATAKAAVVTVRGGKGHGSGFLVSPNGYIITNAHVIFGTGDKPVVRFLSGAEKPAELIKIDNLRDLALLKVDCGRCRYLPMGDSDSVAAGDAVVAVGTPLALKNEGMVTSGQVKGKHAIYGIGRGLDFIQSSILTAPGNSGGPLLNRDRRVVGVNTLSNFMILAKYYMHTGRLLGDKLVGYASPINEVKRFVEK